MSDQFIQPVKPAKKTAKPKAKKYTSSRIFFILDRSGSMESVRTDTIGGFNAFLEEQKNCKQKATFTLVLFDDKYEVPYDGVALEEVQPLTRETFVPRGWTALLDAVGRTVNTHRKAKKGEKTIVAILTDGAENKSCEYQHHQIKSLIEEVQGEGWDVMFIGANIDAAAVGGSMGIMRGKTASFAATGKGVADVMKTVSYASNASRGMEYEWMGTAAAAGCAMAAADGSLDMNMLYSTVMTGDDEKFKTATLGASLAKFKDDKAKMSK